MIHQLVMSAQHSLAHLAEERATSLLVLADMFHQIFVPVAVETTSLTLERALIDHSSDVLKHQVLIGRMAK